MKSLNKFLIALSLALLVTGAEAKAQIPAQSPSLPQTSSVMLRRRGKHGHRLRMTLGCGRLRPFS